MIRPLCILLLIALSTASAQVTLSTVAGGVATPAGQVYDFGNVALGATANADFRLSNTGSTPVYLSYLNVGGATPSPYFSVVCSLSPDLCGGAQLQQLPILINPTGTLDFTVQFKPLLLGSPSTTMTICAADVCEGNSISVLLVGTGVPGLSVLWNNQPVGVGQTITFSSVQVGSSQTIALQLANQTRSPLSVPTIPALPAGVFTLSGSALTATSVAPGASAELDITFAPTETGLAVGTLTIGISTYGLEGTGVAPPPADFPSPSIQLNAPNAASAQQGSLTVTLASPAAASGAGTVTLAFQSAVAGVSDDPAITFADGTRSAAFTVSEGSAATQFSGNPTISFGTGTTAGTLNFNVTLGSKTGQATLTIPAALIGIDAAVAARNVACAPSVVYCTTTNVQLQVNGWDNTRSASQLTFTFFDSSGNAIAPGNITVDAGSAFNQYFGASDLAGVFGLSALFPVTGDTDLVVAARVQLTNSAGTVETAKITF